MQSIDSDILIYFWDSEGSDSIHLGTLSNAGSSSIHDWHFNYEPVFMKTDLFAVFDPCLKLFQNKNYKPLNDPLYYSLTDSAPDHWGKKLLQKSIKSKSDNVEYFQHKMSDSYNNVEYFQYDHDNNALKYLLLVKDPIRKGAIRFKLNPTGSFLDQDTHKAVPGIDYLDVIEKGINVIENELDSAETEHALKTLSSPAASLGGSKPKCSVRDHNDQLWIAKCPSIHDQIDRGVWEYLIWLMAKQCGIDVPDAGLQKGIHDHHIFLTKRFDRLDDQRIHFISAKAAIELMNPSMLANRPDYLLLAEFIHFHGADPKYDMHQLWRRLIFNLIISNHDDHPKNHGFLLTDKGWRLSPAFDLNPAALPSKDNRPLTINFTSGKRDIHTAFELGKYMRLTKIQMNQMVEEVYDAVSSWKMKANQLGIKSDEIDQMGRAFILPEKYQQSQKAPSKTSQGALKKSFFRDLKKKIEEPDNE